MVGGPRNFDENRLRKPPHPRYKSQLNIKMYLVQGNAGVCNRGYDEILVDPRFWTSKSNIQKWIHNPDNGDILFWCSQGSRHSVIVYNNKYYALMGTRGIRKKEDHPNGHSTYETIGKILSLLEINFDHNVREWIDDCIGEILINITGTDSK